MNATEQLLALQNMARSNGSSVEIHQKITQDKRKTVPMFFAQLTGGRTFSPVLDYTGLNCFLMGAAAMAPNARRIYDNADVEKLLKSHDELLAVVRALVNCQNYAMSGGAGVPVVSYELQAILTEAEKALSTASGN